MALLRERTDPGAKGATRRRATTSLSLRLFLQVYDKTLVVHLLACASVAVAHRDLEHLISS